MTKTAPSSATATGVPLMECETLDDVRVHIDRLDDIIAPLLCERAHYVHQAAKFKASPEAVIIPERIDAVAHHARAIAEKLGANPDLLEDLYRGMVDAYIRDEQRRWHEINGK